MSPVASDIYFRFEALDISVLRFGSAAVHETVICVVYAPASCCRELVPCEMMLAIGGRKLAYTHSLTPFPTAIVTPVMR
jgi:hypothetical protein